MHNPDFSFAASASPESSPDNDNVVVWPARLFAPRHAAPGHKGLGCHLSGTPTVAICGFASSCRRPLCAQSAINSPFARRAFA